MGRRSVESWSTAGNQEQLESGTYSTSTPCTEPILALTKNYQ